MRGAKVVQHYCDVSLPLIRKGRVSRTDAEVALPEQARLAQLETGESKPAD